MDLAQIKQGVRTVISYARNQKRKYKSTKKLRPRKYQLDAVDATIQHLAHHPYAINEIATGLGKTFIIKLIAEKVLRNNKRGLYITHSTLFFAQFQDEFADTGSDIYPVELTGHDHMSRLSMASIQYLVALKRRNSAAYWKLIRLFDYAFIDEVHHFEHNEEEVQKWNEIARDLHQSDCKFPAMTATANRFDGSPILVANHDDHIVYRYGIEAAVHDGYLSEVYALVVQTKVTPDDAQWDGANLKLKFNNAKLTERARVIEKTLELVTKERKQTCQTIIFVPRRAEAHAMSKILGEHCSLGCVASMDCYTRKTERERLLDGFRKGEVSILINVGVLGEGVNLPNCNTVVMARPTRWKGRYLQNLGRGTRICEGKDFLLVIDVVDNIKYNHYRELQSCGKLIGCEDSEAVNGPIFTQKRRGVQNGRIVETMYSRDELFVHDSDRKKVELLEMAKRGEPRPHHKTSLGQALQHYISNQGSSYDPQFDKNIRRVGAHWFVHTANENKKKLLKMAEQGKPRPSKKTSLGQALNSYIYKGNCYNPDFDKDIHRAGAHWFVYAADENKKKLLEMAKRGEPRPSKKTSLGIALINYTNNQGRLSDPQFYKDIRRASAHWFVHTADENKKKLLEMAKRGEPRPNWNKTSLGRALISYTGNRGKLSDPQFYKDIHRVGTRWFVNTADENKKKLLEMAKRGEPRPNSSKTSLGKALVSYTSKSNDCYNPDFDKNIRRVGARWFVNTADENKKKLLEMAKRGEPRPSKKTSLGIALINYIRDPQFDKDIRRVGAHWFNLADKKKKKLLEMAKRGEPRPNWETPLGRTLSSYIRNQGSSRDSQFDKDIRKAGAHWFVNTADKKKQLLKMAKQGEPRPNQKTPLGRVLKDYIRNRGRLNDPQFYKDIHAVAPHWFRAKISPQRHSVATKQRQSRVA